MATDVTIGRLLVKSIRESFQNNRAASTLFTFDPFTRFEEVGTGGEVLVFLEDMEPTRQARSAWSSAVTIGLAQCVAVSPRDEDRVEAWLDNWDTLTDLAGRFTNVDELTPFGGRYDLDYFMNSQRLVTRASIVINYPQ